jgi:N-acetylglucosaminyldiphosphoundecaprenol N-acetyl-beta-D-mannosaminyltransferase
MNERFNIGSVSINRANLSDSLSEIKDIYRQGRTGYICFMDTRTAYLANHDDNYCKIQCNSLLTLPDAMPLVWYAHNLGYSEVGKASGADFMELVFSVSVKNGYSHYFYGSTPDTIDMIKKNLINKYPGISILHFSL